MDKNNLELLFEINERLQNCDEFVTVEYLNYNQVDINLYHRTRDKHVIETTAGSVEDWLGAILVSDDVIDYFIENGDQ